MYTHCGVVTPYGDIELGQPWLRYWLVAWKHQTISWTNIDLSSLRAPGIHFITRRSAHKDRKFHQFCNIASRSPNGRRVNVHFMVTSTNGNIFGVIGPFVGGIHRSPVNSPHKGQQRGALMFPLIFAWVNNREAGDLRRHRAHYDVIVMSWRNLKYSRSARPSRYLFGIIFLI